MNHSRRSFLENHVKLCGAGLLLWPESLLSKYKINTRGNKDWDHIRSLFPISAWEKIHFNSGSAGVMPLPVQDYLFDLIRQMNAIAPYEAWNQWQGIKSQNLTRLSQYLHTSPEEIQVVRNTTEALNMIIYGIPLNKGDEVIIAEHDYPFAINAYENRALRDGISLKKIKCALPATHDEVLQYYKEALSDNTKIVHLTYMTHHEGHILPVKAIIEMCHQRGIQVVVDGAHTLAHIDVNLSYIRADYYATSLHKWLNAPHGTGLLYVKREHISRLHNHPSSNPSSFDSINKYEHLGTRAFHQEIGIAAALDFHEWVGFDKKKERLLELNRYWISKIADLDKVSIHTDLTTGYSGAIGTFSIEGISGSNIVKQLDIDYDIHAKSVGLYSGSGVRISVNIFTSISDLDRLVLAVSEIAA